MQSIRLGSRCLFLGPIGHRKPIRHVRYSTEAFCDMLAIGGFQDLYQQSPAKMARSIARFRQATVAIEPKEAKHMQEVAELLNAYPKYVEHSGSPPKGIDPQISYALKFLGESGVFDRMLLGPEEWQRIHDEGCDGCFQRNALRN